MIKKAVITITCSLGVILSIMYCYSYVYTNLFGRALVESNCNAILDYYISTLAPENNYNIIEMSEKATIDGFSQKDKNIFSDPNGNYYFVILEQKNDEMMLDIYNVNKYNQLFNMGYAISTSPDSLGDILTKRILETVYTVSDNRKSTEVHQ